MCYCACFCSNIIEAFQKCEHVIWYMWKARFHSFGVSRHLRLSTTFSRLQNFTELMESKWCDPPTQPPTPKKKKKKETDSTPHRTTSSHRVVEFQSSTVRKNEIVLKVLVNEGQSEVPSSRGWRSFLFLCPNILSQCREAATRGNSPVRMTGKSPAWPPVILFVGVKTTNLIENYVFFVLSKVLFLSYQEREQRKKSVATVSNDSPILSPTVHFNTFRESLFPSPGSL